MKKKFAFLLMGAHYDPARHQADFETENRLTSIRTVRDYRRPRPSYALFLKMDTAPSSFAALLGKKRPRSLSA